MAQMVASSSTANSLRGMKNILVTGMPGVGKTTCIQYLVNEIECLRKANLSSQDVKIEVTGFYSKEKRQNGYRIGFDIIGIPNNKHFILARTQSHLPQNMFQNFQTKPDHFPKVGKYIVDLPGFEMNANNMLKSIINDSKSSKNNVSIVIIDEIGKMELFSKKFEENVSQLINHESVIVIATVPIKNNIKFVNNLKSRKDSKLYQLSHENRNGLKSVIFSDLTQIIDNHLKMKLNQASKKESYHRQDNGHQNMNKQQKSNQFGPNQYNQGENKYHHFHGHAPGRGAAVAAPGRGQGQGHPQGGRSNGNSQYRWKKVDNK